VGGVDPREAVSGGTEEVIEPIPMQDGNSATALFEDRAHVFREKVVAVVFLGIFVEQLIVEVDELFSISACYKVEVADNPADLLKIPVVGQPDEAVIGGNVGGKRELTAAKCAEVALAVFGTAASHQVHISGRLRFHFRHVDGIFWAFIAA